MPLNIPSSVLITAGVRGTQEVDRLRNSMFGINKVGSELRSLFRTLVPVATVAGFIAFTKSTFASVDALAKQADILNIATEALATYKVNADLAGVDTEKFSNALRKMLTNVGDAIDGTGEAAETLKRLGVNAKELSALRSDEIFERIAEKIRGLATQADKANVAARIFGERDGVKMLALIEQMAGPAGVTRQQLEALGIALSRVDAGRVEEANDAMTKAGLVAKGVGNTIAVTLAPVLNEMATSFFEAGVAAGGFQKEVKAATVATLRTLAQLADGFALTFDAIGQSFTTFGQTVGAGFAQAVAVLRGDLQLARQIGSAWWADQQEQWSSLANDPSIGSYLRRLDEIIEKVDAAGAGPPRAAAAAPRGDRDPVAFEKEQEEIRKQIQKFNADLLKAADEQRESINRLLGTYDKQGQALEQLSTDQVRLHEELVAGTITLEQYRAAIDGVGEAYSELGAEDLEEVKNDLNVFAEQAARNIQNVTASLLKGELAGKDFGKAIINALRDIAAEIAAQQLLRSLFGSFTGNEGWLGAFARAVVGTQAHRGGVMGQDSLPQRSLSEAAFVGAPRLHGGLMPDEYPAILKRGEGVFTPGQMRALGGSAKPPVSVSIVNNIDARGADPTSAANMLRALEETSKQTEARIYEAIRRGYAPIPR